MLNIEKYATEMKEKFSEVGDIGASVFSIYRLRGLRDSYNYVFTAEEVFEWLLSECKEPLISETERNYLRDLKHENNFIAIRRNCGYLELLIELENQSYLRVWSLPCKCNMSFTGLENEKVYTLEELQV